MKKRLVFALLTLCLLSALFPAAGAADGAIEIDSAEALAKIGTDAAYPLDGDYVLTVDIALTEPWTTIASGATASADTAAGCFTGTFDGGGHTISGLAGANGLFQAISGEALVENLRLSVAITAAASDVGGVAGSMAGGTIQNCTVSGSVLGEKGVGGIVGRVYAAGTVADCVNEAAITATTYNGGGIAGQAYYTRVDKSMVITGCQNEGTVTGPYGLGGIVGLCAADVENCTNTAAVENSGSGSGDSIGGIVGEQTMRGTVSGCVNEGNVSGGIAGGIVGWVRYNKRLADYAACGRVEVRGNENSGAIALSGTAGWNGGIIGTVYNTAVVAGNTNTAASIEGKTFAAGIVGNMQFTETNNASSSESWGNTPANQVIITGNETTTALANITADCKHEVAYNNDSGNVYDNEVSDNLTPSMAVEVDGTYYGSLSDAVEAAADGAIIKLRQDITLTDTGVTINNTQEKALTLDLNQKTFTIQNGSKTNNRGMILYDGKLKIRNGTMIAEGGGTTAADGTGAYGVLRVEGGELYLEDVTLKNSRPFGLNVKMTGGTSEPYAKFTRVTIESAYGGGVEVMAGTADFYDCTFTQRGYFDHCSSNIAVSNMATANVYSGSYSSESGAALYCFSSGGTINVHGGTFDAGKWALAAQIDSGTYPNGISRINASGGDFLGAFERTNSEKAILSFTGGRFTADPSAYVAEGYLLRERDGKFEVYRKSSGGSSGDNKPKPIPNPDGSTTATETKPDGTVSETTKTPDGGTKVVETKPDGSMSASQTLADGSKGTTTVSAAGEVKAEAVLSEKAVKAGVMARLPIEPIKPADNNAPAPVVTVAMPQTAGRVAIEVPVVAPTLGTVAVLVLADGTEQIIPKTALTEQGIALTLTGTATIKIVDNSKDFADVRQEDWYAGAVDFASSRELFAGTDADSFSPEQTMTRGMLVTVLQRLEGGKAEADTGFGDVAPDAYYAGAAAWAAEQGIVTGGADGAFGAEDNVTREQLAVMLYRLAGEPAADGAALTDFTDGAQASDWAAGALQWATAQGLLSGKGDGVLDPAGTATRAEVATILMRVVAKQT